MALLKVTLTKIIDSSFPLFGAFEFIDTSGEAVVIHEKLPVVGLDMREEEVSIPLDAALECNIISEAQGAIQINTGEPHGVSDIRGRTRFHVSAELVVK